MGRLTSFNLRLQFLWVQRYSKNVETFEVTKLLIEGFQVLLQAHICSQEISILKIIKGALRLFFNFAVYFCFNFGSEFLYVLGRIAMRELFAILVSFVFIEGWLVSVLRERGDIGIVYLLSLCYLLLLNLCCPLHEWLLSWLLCIFFIRGLNTFLHSLLWFLLFCCFHLDLVFQCSFDFIATCSVSRHAFIYRLISFIEYILVHLALVFHAFTKKHIKAVFKLFLFTSALQSEGLGPRIHLWDCF